MPIGDIQVNSEFERPLGQVSTNLGQELTGAVRFADVVIAARLAAFVFIAAQGIGRDGDDRDRAQCRVRLDAARRLVAVNAQEAECPSG